MEVILKSQVTASPENNVENNATENLGLNGHTSSSLGNDSIIVIAQVAATK